MHPLPNVLLLWSIISATQALVIPVQPQCPNYERHSRAKHEGNRSTGRHELPFQRPMLECRTYYSEEVEEAIERLKPKITDPDLYRLFENSYPNTLDTMVKWKGFAWSNQTLGDEGGFTDEDLAFVITGDMYGHIGGTNCGLLLANQGEATRCGSATLPTRYCPTRPSSDPRHPRNPSLRSFAASSTPTHATYGLLLTVTRTSPCPNPKSLAQLTTPTLATISISSTIAQRHSIANGSSTR